MQGRISIARLLQICNTSGMGVREQIMDVAKRRGLDYKALADRAGLPRPTVFRYLKGTNDLTGGRIDRLLDALSLQLGQVRRSRLPKQEFPVPLFMQPAEGTSPILRYPGSKWRLMLHVIPLMPAHDHYVSVFGGSGSDILRKPPSSLETFNDIDGHVFGFFSLLQDKIKMDQLRERLATTPAQSQRHFEQAVGLMDTATDPVERTWAFLVVSFQGFCVASPSSQTPTHWRYARRPHTTAKSWFKLPTAIEIASDRFRAVQIMNQPWQDVISRMDLPATLFLIDPPYHPDALNQRFYANSMTAGDHEQLLDALLAVKGFVILCGYTTPLYNERLARWRNVPLMKPASLAVHGNKPTRTEMLWLNYDETGNRLK